MGNFITGGLSGLAGFAGSVVDSINSSQQQKRQIQHDKDMAALNQQNILEQMSQSQQYNEHNMALQNQYQLEQWQRENEYNDPSAVAARYKAAGINPKAAFGTGAASGAGVAGGLSSSPSGGSPSGSNTATSSNIMFDTDFAGLGSSLPSAFNLSSVISKRKSEKLSVDLDNQIKEIEANYTETKLLTKLQEMRANIAKQLSDAKKGSVEYEVLLKSINEIDSRIARNTKLNEETDQNIAQSKQAVKESQKRENVLDEQARELKASNDLFKSTGIRPGMSVEQALMSAGASLLDLKKDDIRNMLQKLGLLGDSNSVTEEQVKNASQVLQDEYDRLDTLSRGDDKEAYYRYKMRLWHNLAITFK